MDFRSFFERPVFDRFRGRFWEDFRWFFDVFGRLFEMFSFVFVGPGLKMENCVLTAPAQVDCMCDLPEGQLGASVFPDVFDVFPRLLTVLDFG